MSTSNESGPERTEPRQQITGRRSFLKTVAAAALAGGATLAASNPASAAMRVKRAVSCDTQYDIDIADCNKQKSRAKRAVCRSRAMVDYVACKALEAAETAIAFVGRTVRDFTNWAQQNPGLVVLGIVVIIGAVILVWASGGAAAPALVALA